MNLKIGIVGAGTASAITLLTLQHRINDIKKNNKVNFEIELCVIHEPTISRMHVGESVGPQVLQMLESTLNYTYNKHQPCFNEALRYGSIVDWSEINSKIRFIHYGTNSGLSIDSTLFADWVFYRLKSIYKNVFEIKDTVIDIYQNENKVYVKSKLKVYEFDYVFECTGTPSLTKLQTEDYVLLKDPVINSAVVYQGNRPINEPFSIATAHEYGWMFGIPIFHRKAFGYCYNNKFITTEQALVNLSKILAIEVNLKNTKQFSWNHYFKKKVIDNRILSTGNLLYFFEPQQGLPLQVYMMIARRFMSQLEKDNFSLSQNSKDEINTSYTNLIENIHDIIYFNYAGKNNLNNEFWNFARNISIIKLRSSKGFKKWCQNQNEHWWPHPAGLVKQYIDAYDVDIKEIFENEI